MTRLVKLESLDECEQVINTNLQSFVDAGRALLKIRENFKTWGLKSEFSSFENYCQKKWDITRRHADRLIEAHSVVDEVRPMGLTSVPSNERQARALAAAPEDQRAEVWKEAVDTAPAGKVTAKHITEVINKSTGEVMFVADVEVQVTKETRPVTRPKPFQTAKPLKALVVVHCFHNAPEEAAQTLFNKLDAEYLTTLVARLGELLGKKEGIDHGQDEI